MAITDWPEGDRPREKLLARGAAALVRRGTTGDFPARGRHRKKRGGSGRDLLNHFGGLTRLFASEQAAFSAFPGMGPAKYAQLQAVLEMSRRALGEDMRAGDALNSPKAVRDWLRLKLSGLGHEVFVAVFLDAQNRVIESEELFRGTLTQTSVYPREIVKRALAHNAAGVILAHNHPSGVAEPSQADRWLTDQLKSALGLVDVKVLDHFIVAGGSGLSFAERGWL
jgi:DNA repair protein RadC